MDQGLTRKQGTSYLHRVIETKAIFIVSALLAALLFILFGQYIFGDYLFLFNDIGGDTIRFNWPVYFHYSQYLRHEGIPTWTFSQGLGQNVFPAYLGDVCSWLLYVVKPDQIPAILVYVQVLKIFLAGLFFFLFLRKSGPKAYLAITGALLYAFSGFMVIGSTWFIFTTEGLYLALLLYSMALFIHNNNRFIFPVAVALIAAYNPILLLSFSLFICVYILGSAFLGLYENITRSMAGLFFKLVLLGILGIGIGSFLMFGNINQMLESPRGSGGVSLANDLISTHVFGPGSLLYFKTFLLRMLGNDMAGYAGPVSNSFTGWNNYLEAPMQYCSLFSLLLLPQLFVLANRKMKIMAAACLIAALVPVIFPFFRYAFWLFQGEYFRTYSLLFGVLQILLALKSLSLIVEQKKINALLLFGTLMVLLTIPFCIDIANHHLRWVVVFFLIIEALLLLTISIPRFYSISAVGLPVFVFAELCFMSWGALHERSILKKGELDDLTGYHDHTTEAVAFIHASDSGFYRLHKGADHSELESDSRTFNHAMLQGYYGLSSYHPFNQKYYVKFLQKMNLISGSNEWETRMIHGLGNHPLLRDLVSTKYLLMSGKCNDFCNGYDSVANIKGVVIYRNKFFLPLGFTYNAYISETETVKLKTNKDTLLLKAFVTDDDLYAKELYGIKKLSDSVAITDDSTKRFEVLIDKLKKDTLQISSFSQNRIKGSINSGEREFLFFSIPFDKGWIAEVDGKEQKVVIANYGFWGLPLNKGVHQIVLTYSSPYYRTGALLSVFSLMVYAAFAGTIFFKRKTRAT